MPDVPLGAALLEPAGMNAWGDFNNAIMLPDAEDPPPVVQVPVAVDPAAIATFLDVVFSYCDGFIPVRGFVDKGQDLEANASGLVSMA